MRRYGAWAVMGVVAVAACGAPAQNAPPPPAPATPPAAAPPEAIDAGAAPSVLEDAAPLGAETVADGAAEVSAADAGENPTASAHAGGESTSACNEQGPQEFLVRGNFLKAGQEAMRRAIQYRTDTYGYFKGFGRAPANADPPSTFTVTTKFMGLPVRMHRKVVPALACVEEEIHRSCAAHPYKAEALAGIRFRNTYRGGEVTNHIYGIAIDIDPARNTCCGCVPPWNDAPACKRPGKSEYDHMDMPECWVHAFERYGFYWLGHDRLRDTMHFEFLGDPDHILKNPPAAKNEDGGARSSQ